MVEKPCVGQPRAHHATVAVDDVFRVRDLHIAHQQKLFGELVCLVEQREIFLVGAHGEDQAFLRHREKLRIKTGDVDHGPFDQRGHFVEQRLEFTQCAVQFGGLGLELCVDFRAARVEAGDDFAVVHQPRLIVVGDFQLNVARAEKTMAMRGASRRQAQCLHINDIRAMQRHQAMRGAHELDGLGAAIVILQLIAHHLRDRQLRDGFFQRRRQTRLQGLSGGQLRQKQHHQFAVAGFFN